ncbi:MAG: nuclear transport factor 2 family protein [Acidimicrobiia bacterium]|nr:nuclear transport factor 2 family protein [Acidimicrobiia bacterium]
MNSADLVVMERIKRLKYRYMRCLDQKRWDDLATCFTHDAVASYSGGRYHFEGRDAILEFLETSMGAETFLSSHRVHHPEIDLTGPATAHGTWALDDVVVETAWDVTIRGAAFYEDDYVLVDNVWLISHTGYRRTYEEIQPRGEVPGLQLTASWFIDQGRSSLGAD